MTQSIPPKPPRYLWQHPAWPALTFDVAALAQDLSNARLEQGKLLGLADLPTTDRHVDGLVQVMADATGQYQAALTQERLFLWQAALFPGGSATTCGV